jgi:hypothetical protein
VVGAAFAQLPSSSAMHFSPYTLVKKKPVNLFSINNTALTNLTTLAPRPSIMVITPNFYTAGFGFFCRQELKFEKKTNIPFRFRLGSVTTCDRLEGKKVSITQ